MTSGTKPQRVNGLRAASESAAVTWVRPISTRVVETLWRREKHAQRQTDDQRTSSAPNGATGWPPSSPPPLPPPSPSPPLSPLSPPPPAPGAIRLGWNKVRSKMSRADAEHHVDERREEREPRRLEMEISAPAILIGKHVVVAGRNGGTRRRHRHDEQRRRIDVAGFAPIEAWMREDNSKPLTSSASTRDAGEPVRDADEQSVSRNRQGLTARTGRFMVGATIHELHAGGRRNASQEALRLGISARDSVSSWPRGGGQCPRSWARHVMRLE